MTWLGRLGLRRTQGVRHINTIPRCRGRRVSVCMGRYGEERGDGRLEWARRTRRQSGPSLLPVIRRVPSDAHSNLHPLLPSLTHSCYSSSPSLAYITNPSFTVFSFPHSFIPSYHLPPSLPFIVLPPLHYYCTLVGGESQYCQRSSQGGVLSEEEDRSTEKSGQVRSLQHKHQGLLTAQLLECYVTTRPKPYVETTNCLLTTN